MKMKYTGCLIAAAALVTSSATFAGDTYVEPAPVMPPPAAPSLWNWFIGGSGGYWFDSEEEFWSIHIGAEKFNGDTSHAFFLEVGWSGSDDSYDSPYGGGGSSIPQVDVDVDYIPVTFNYKFERPLFGSQRLHWYAGAGIGILFADVDIDDDIMGNIGGGSDEVLMGQLFAGLEFDLGQNLEIYGGGRWIWMDDVDGFDNGDEGVAELGLRWNF